MSLQDLLPLEPRSSYGFQSALVVIVVLVCAKALGASGIIATTPVKSRAAIAIEPADLLLRLFSFMTWIAWNGDAIKDLSTLS